MIESYHLYLTGTRARLRRQSGWPWRRRTEAIGEWDWDPATPASLTLGSLLVSRKTRPALHIYVGSALSKFVALELPTGLRSPQERGVAAQAQMQHLLGLSASDWEFTLDSAAPPGKSVVCAVRRLLMARVRDLASENQLRLVSLRPYAAIVWNVAAQVADVVGDDTQSALLAVEDDSYTVVIAHGRQLAAISGMQHRRESGLVEREIKRLAYTLGEGSSQRIHLALSEGMSAAAQLHADKIVRIKGRPGAFLYPDFRDLLFFDEAIETEGKG